MAPVRHLTESIDAPRKASLLRVKSSRASCLVVAAEAPQKADGIAAPPKSSEACHNRTFEPPEHHPTIPRLQADFRTIQIWLKDNH